MKREFRITRSIDFKRVRRLGKPYAHPLVVLIATPAENENSRAGFITGKSIGNAVKRNRVKRQLKAVLSEFLPHFINQSDVLVIAREPVTQATYQDLRIAIQQLLIKADLIGSDEYHARRSTG